MDEKARESNRLRQRKFLEQHKDEVNTKRREKYHERINLGKCPRCGNKVKKGRTLCAACCEYMLTLNRKYITEKQADVQPKIAAAKASAEKAPVKAKTAAPKTAAKTKAVKK